MMLGLVAPLWALALAQVFPPWVTGYWTLPVPARDAPACDGCHPREAHELSGSIHGGAASPGVLGQLPTAGPHRASGLACLMCHAPEDVQQPWRAQPSLPPAQASLSPPSRLSLALTDATPLQDNPDFRVEAEHRGVSCAACHWRAGAVVTSTDHVISPAAQAAHPVRAEGLLQQPALCATCHQFGPEAAVNGKPVENTWMEMQKSFWGKGGATCQGCHMPDGQHRFTGIHTPDLVAASVEVVFAPEPGIARGTLTLTNEAVGHDFPTYATPRVTLMVQGLGRSGRPKGAPAVRVLGRGLRVENGEWHETEDTRVPPGESARLAFDLSKERPAAIKASAWVEPDFAYVAFYEDLLARGDLPPERRAAIEAALARAKGSAYPLFEQQRRITQDALVPKAARLPSDP